MIDYSAELDIIASDFVVYVVHTALVVYIWQMFRTKIILIKLKFKDDVKRKSSEINEEEKAIKKKSMITREKLNFTNLFLDLFQSSLFLLFLF